MREHDGLSWTHEKVVEGLLKRLHEMVVGHGKSFQLCGIFDQFLGGLDAEGFGKSGVTLTLSALGHTFKLGLLLGHGIASTGATGHALLKVTARATLDDSCERFVSTDLSLVGLYSQVAHGSSSGQDAGA